MARLSNNFYVIVQLLAIGLGLNCYIVHFASLPFEMTIRAIQRAVPFAQRWSVKDKRFTCFCIVCMCCFVCVRACMCMCVCVCVCDVAFVRVIRSIRILCPDFQSSAVSRSTNVYCCILSFCCSHSKCVLLFQEYQL